LPKNPAWGVPSAVDKSAPNDRLTHDSGTRPYYPAPPSQALLLPGSTPALVRTSAAKSAMQDRIGAMHPDWNVGILLDAIPTDIPSGDPWLAARPRLRFNFRASCTNLGCSFFP
jgi:hypothetical protein